MFYITSKKQLLKSGLRYGGNIGILDIPCYDSLQIDTMDDLNLTKKILEKQYISFIESIFAKIT